MKFWKNPRLLTGLSLLALVGVLTGIWCFRTPSREISRAELLAFLQTHALSEGRVAPTPYSGIYSVEGLHATAAGREKVFITTHLDDAQVKSIFDEAALKMQ